MGLINPAQMPMMPPIGMPPINPLYYANPEDPTAMINLMHWQNQALANPMAFNQPNHSWMPPPPPIPISSQIPAMPPIPGKFYIYFCLIQK